MNQVIVYAGRHYGSVHQVVTRQGNMLTCRHEASGSGDTVTVHVCDTETV